MKLHEVIESIRSIVGNNRKIIIFGKGLTQLITGKKPKNLDIFIQVKDKDDLQTIHAQLPYLTNIKYHLCNSFDEIEKDPIVINNIFILADDLNNNDENIENIIHYHKNFFRDFQRNLVSFTKNAKKNFKTEYIFEALETAVEHNFFIENKSIDIIMKNKHLVKDLYKRQIYNLLHTILQTQKPQKYIEFLNIFGISFELFGFHLNASLDYKKLEKEDFPEFIFSILKFNNEDEFKNILLNKCGVYEKDLKNFLIIYKAFHEVDLLNTNLTNIEKIYSILEGKRVLNFCRLLKLFEFNEISKILRKYHIKKISNDVLDQ